MRSLSIVNNDSLVAKSLKSISVAERTSVILIFDNLTFEVTRLLAVIKSTIDIGADWILPDLIKFHANK